jgi:DNA (cytosine-5)-methyltransferase 1
MLKVGSDFSGVGAFNQALTRLGVEYQEIFACDMDKYARQTFIHNYGEPKYYPTNVYDREIPSESLDIYMTSPPCQAFSLAGKRLGKDDKRGILFFNSYEFIQKNNPRFFIFENVKGLLSDDGGNTFQEWINMLGGRSVNGLPILFPYDNALPYHLYWQVLNAKHHGVPQNRERVFLIGIRDDKDNNFRFPAEEHLSKRLKDVLEEEVDDKYFLSEKMVNVLNHHNNPIIKNETPKNSACIHAGYFKMGGRDQQYLKIGTWRTHKDGQGFREIEDGNCPTIPARARPTMTATSADERILNDYKIRRLTPRECFRLMDFPDTFTWDVSDSQAYKQAGNSIVVRVLEKIIKNLLQI